MSTRIQHTAYKTGARGKGRDHADYIAGKGKNAGKEDVIFLHDGNLPAWARDAGDFFEAADEFERGDYKVRRKSRDGEEYQKLVKGRAYTEFEWSVPRGIKDPVAWAKRVADETLGSDFVFRLAVHDAPASDGGRNINMHLMFSDRRLDGIERDRELFFKRAKSGSYCHRKTGQLVSHDPTTGGTKKDRFWNQKGRPKWARSLFERHVQRELPDFKLSKSKNPEPKIGPVVKKAGKEHEEQRRAIEATVLKMRALRLALESVDLELAESLGEPQSSTRTDLHQCPASPMPQTPTSAPVELKRAKGHVSGSVDPRWLEFETALMEIGKVEFNISWLLLDQMRTTIEPRFAELADEVAKKGLDIIDLARLTAEHLNREELGIEADLTQTTHKDWAEPPQRDPGDERDSPGW